MSYDHSKILGYGKSHGDAATTPPRTTQRHGNDFYTLLILSGVSSLDVSFRFRLASVTEDLE